MSKQASKGRRQSAGRMKNKASNLKKTPDEPIIPASQSLPEITLRVLVLGILLTIVLAAANAYLGLKVGMTVSASIPAAVISMGILRFFRNSNILENTMVQIMASVGEALTAGIAFILPALLILRVWENFNYWQTVITGLLGGLVGVLFTIPLRRALLKDPTLRFPEALAIGNVLKASAMKEEGDLRALTAGGVVGAGIALFQSGFQILTDAVAYWFKAGNVIVGFGLGFSPALIAAGYIVGMNLALSVLVGVLIGWIAGVPILSTLYSFAATDSANDIALDLWRDHIRYIGVGTMLVGGLWTMLTLFRPMADSIAASFVSIKQLRAKGDRKELRTERDFPIHYVALALLLLLIPIFFLILKFIPSQFELSFLSRYGIAAFSTLFILVGGFIFCSISAYFAGLVGSTNNPVSGMLVSALLIISLCLMALFGLTNWGLQAKELIGSTVAIGSMVVIGAALAISNDTMQDLKVGQIMGATPWKQQLMLVLGVVVSAFIVPPILQLLYNAYGIAGVYPRENMDPSQMLAAPQAALMATVARGAFSHHLEWSMITAGAVIAVIAIGIDEFLKRNFTTRLPVLAVGVGIYLPLDASVPMIIGGLLSYLVQLGINAKQKRTKQDMSTNRNRGLLLSCGIVAGASLMGVALAIPFALRESSDALRLMPLYYEYLTPPLSIAITIALCAWIYYIVMRK